MSIATRNRAWAIAAAAVLVVLFAQTWSKAMRPDGNDLTSYLLSAQALSEGRSPYSPDTPFPYVYPMLLAFVLVPWLVMPYGVAVFAWFVASVAALGALVWKSADGMHVAAAATVVITFAAIQNTLLNGQVNFFVVLCCVMAVAAAHERRDTTAGIWLGAGIALKLMPALLGMYFLLRGRTRAIMVSGAVAITLSFVPAVLLGDAAMRAYEEYGREFLLPILRDSATARRDPLVFSLPGLVSHSLGADAPRWIAVASAVAVLAAVTAADVFRWRPRQQDLAAAAGYMLAIVLISPKSEVHHLAFAIPAVAICSSWLAAGVGGQDRWAAAAMGAAAAGLMLARLAGAAQGVVLCASIVLLGVALASLTPSSASRPGTRNLPSSSPSYPAAVP